MCNFIIIFIYKIFIIFVIYIDYLLEFKVYVIFCEGFVCFDDCVEEQNYLCNFCVVLMGFLEYIDIS